MAKSEEPDVSAEPDVLAEKDALGESDGSVATQPESMATASTPVAK